MKKLNLSYAVGEVLLIFIGITLAIAFQNWNENRKSAKLEHAVLEQLKVALQNDLADVNANISTHKYGKVNCQETLETLSKEETIHPDFFIQGIMRSSDFTFLISDVSTYEYLKSVGLHIIQNDSLRKQITHLYDVVYESIYGIEGNSEFLQKDIIENLKRYYSANADGFIPNDNFKKLKKNNDLKFDLKAIELSHQNMINRYENRIKPELELLIQMVDVELGH
jgi:hypothetical protein